jgi:hypothetical protein
MIDITRKTHWMTSKSLGNRFRIIDQHRLKFVKECYEKI